MAIGPALSVLQCLSTQEAGVVFVQLPVACQGSSDTQSGALREALAACATRSVAPAPLNVRFCATAWLRGLMPGSRACSEAADALLEALGPTMPAGAAADGSLCCAVLRMLRRASHLCAAAAAPAVEGGKISSVHHLVHRAVAEVAVTRPADKAEVLAACAAVRTSLQDGGVAVVVGDGAAMAAETLVRAYTSNEASTWSQLDAQAVEGGVRTARPAGGPAAVRINLDLVLASCGAATTGGSSDLHMLAAELAQCWEDGLAGFEAGGCAAALSAARRASGGDGSKSSGSRDSGVPPQDRSLLVLEADSADAVAAASQLVFGHSGLLLQPSYWTSPLAEALPLCAGVLLVCAEPEAAAAGSRLAAALGGACFGSHLLDVRGAVSARLAAALPPLMLTAGDAPPGLGTTNAHVQPGPELVARLATLLCDLASEAALAAAGLAGGADVPAANISARVSGNSPRPGSIEQQWALGTVMDVVAVVSAQWVRARPANNAAAGSIATRLVLQQAAWQPLCSDSVRQQRLGRQRHSAAGGHPRCRCWWRRLCGRAAAGGVGAAWQRVGSRHRRMAAVGRGGCLCECRNQRSRRLQRGDAAVRCLGLA
jgi:hypothetical protein